MSQNLGLLPLGGPHSLSTLCTGVRQQSTGEIPPLARQIFAPSPPAVWGQQGPADSWGWEPSCCFVGNFSELLNFSGKFSLPFD